MTDPHKLHPGYDAHDCPLRRSVTPSPCGPSQPGYGCDWTGGHCLPGTGSHERVQLWKEREAMFEEIEREALEMEGY